VFLISDPIMYFTAHFASNHVLNLVGNLASHLTGRCSLLVHLPTMVPNKSLTYSLYVHKSSSP
jgi:hypothetical protein